MKSFSLAWLILHALKGIARAIIERKHIGSKCDMGASQKPCQKKSLWHMHRNQGHYKPFFKALQALFQGLTSPFSRPPVGAENSVSWI